MKSVKREKKQRIIHERVCPLCKTPFRTPDVRKVFCKTSCRVLKYQRRQKGLVDHVKTLLRAQLMVETSEEKLQDALKIFRSEE